MYAAPRLFRRAASVDLSGEAPCRGAVAMRASPTRMTPPKVRKSLRIMRQRRMRRGGCPHPPAKRSSADARQAVLARPDEGLRAYVCSLDHQPITGTQVLPYGFDAITPSASPIATL